MAALTDVSIAVTPGTNVGIIGETGAGKSTLLALLLRLLRPSAGRVLWEGVDLWEASAAHVKRYRREVQVVFQDPYSSLNPRLTVAEIVEEPLIAVGLGDREGRELNQALAQVGLGSDALGRLPRAFSGGQRQRIAIARALVTQPRYLILDEPVSALDASMKGQVLNALLDVSEREAGPTLVTVSHDIRTIRCLADEIVVMRDGRIVETGPTEAVYSDPRDEYTRSLLAAANISDV